MRSILFVIRVVLGVIILAQACWAQQLHWENEELKFDPAMTDKIVVAHFKFKNVGGAAVKITSVKSSCSCTKAASDKENLAPGETGEITATFTIGVRTGLQDKIILVESNDVSRPRTVLRMKIAIPEVAKVSPTFLYWSPTESLTAKEICVKILNGFPAKTITVESSDPKITAKVETVKVGEEYRIVVTPCASDQPVMAILTIKTDYPKENPKSFLANIRMQPKK